MRTVLVGLMVWSSGPVALAEDDGTVVVEYDHAEYQRLAEELEKLAQRNAWAGVDRTYRAILEMGAEPSVRDNLNGAHAARALGDVTGARARLERANERIEDKEILDWLWEIDSNYGRVFLACDKGKLELGAAVMPFNPDQRRAVEWAQTQIRETGLFDGYLPQGNYTFGSYTVEVQPRVQSVRIDARTHNRESKKKNR